MLLAKTNGLEERNKLLQLRVNQLEEEVENLKERLLILGKEVMDKEWEPPMEFCLTPQQARTLAALYTRDKLMSREEIFTAIYHDRYDDNLPELKIVDVFICKVRPSLKPYGIEIVTHPCRGYSLSPAGRKILDNWGKEEVDETDS